MMDGVPNELITLGKKKKEKVGKETACNMN